jgi:hypothetical protein
VGAEDDDWPEVAPEPARSIIGQITYHLDHMAEMLYAVDEIEDHHRRMACIDSFLIDFRCLYYFLIENRKVDDAHRFDFLGPSEWQPTRKTAAARRMAALVNFISKYRAHLSKSRFDPPRQALEDHIGVSRVDGKYLARVLLDYLDILDQFIEKLPDDRNSGKKFWRGAAENARYKTEVALGIREPAAPGPYATLTERPGAPDSSGTVCSPQ